MFPVRAQAQRFGGTIRLYRIGGRAVREPRRASLGARRIGLGWRAPRLRSEQRLERLVVGPAKRVCAACEFGHRLQPAQPPLRLGHLLHAEFFERSGGLQERDQALTLLGCARVLELLSLGCHADPGLSPSARASAYVGSKVLRGTEKESCG